MKKTFLIIALALSCLSAMSQQCYWVFLTDKQGTTFDPYTYFDAHAIERYHQCGADLYDISNYPLNQNYVSQVCALATEEVGQSRWINAIGVMATPAQIEAIQNLSCVSHTALIGGNMQIAADSQEATGNRQITNTYTALAPQLLRMQGDKFVAHGFDGKGIRIAVLDNGFPKVNTHRAFKHLRDNNRIIDTWNFPTRKADVYGWGTHGLMTLSCIAGKFDSLQIGLATGAEFLLYRTEINTEPFKEEVWWMRAMERADQHGANIISSSLGYGKERHFTTDMDGTSYVAKAATLAARKGILVCNSAGNEGDDKRWKTIITPSDADSVLCVAGTTADLNAYEHISFSSYGPSADGRLKPNVAAFGDALVASSKNIEETQSAQGTSFSCPLVAGFCACAWQASPGKTAMEMYQLIQQSADLYPYYDYAFGYGVPQASFFTDGQRQKRPTFEFVESNDSIGIRFLSVDTVAQLFFHKRQPNGTIVEYSSATISAGEKDRLMFHKGGLDSCILAISYLGYSDTYQLSKDDQFRMRWEPRPFNMESHSPDDTFTGTYKYQRTADDLKTSQWGNNSRYRADIYCQFGDMVSLTPDSKYNLWSPTCHVGLRVMRAFKKSYSIGLGLECATSKYNINRSNQLDIILLPTFSDMSSRQFRTNEVALELFQRIRFVPGGLFGKGLHFDLGVFLSRTWWNTYHVEFNNYDFTNGGAEFNFKNPSFIDNYQWNYGATARLSYDIIGIYARYRLTGFATYYDLDPASPTAFSMSFPRLELGLELTL